MNIKSPISVKEILFSDDSQYVKDCLISSRIPAYGFITKAKIVDGNNLFFTNASEDDAEFIVNLRNDEKKSRYISKTDSNINKQKEWLQKYSLDNSQAYFIIRDSNERVGTVRIYDQKEDSFCWGSWILKDGISKTFAIESALIVYSYAISIGLRRAHFTVSKGNNSVSRFHERFGATVVKETDDEYFYEISTPSILASLKRYKKYLPDGIRITF
ncbi:TPA: GNAT family N-acetyltransferase [Escherichia albertii]|nr:GNAT family N-acetyltransferase [Escherichia albertii]HAX3032128.1 GNAT family N-acetyltransferase [Escherichia albertii]